MSYGHVCYSCPATCGTDKPDQCKIVQFAQALKEGKVIAVEVFSDGKIELSRVNKKQPFDARLYFSDMKSLKTELLNYGCTEARVREALKELKTEQSVIL